MDLRQINYFLEIARSNSISRAATKVWITQPALSRQIKALEEELGVQLFERTARGMSLTEAGELLYTRATALVQDVASIRREVGAYSQEPTGLLTVGIPPSLQSLVSAPAVERFYRRYPAASLRVREGTSRSMRDLLELGEVDLAVFSTQEPADGFKVEPLATEDLYLVGPRADGLDEQTGIAPEALPRFPLILTPYPNSLRTIVDKAVGEAQPEQPRIEVETSGLMVALVRAGLGYSVMTHTAAHALRSDPALGVYPIQGLGVSWMAATPRDRVSPVGVRKFIEVLQELRKELVDRGIWQMPG